MDKEFIGRIMSRKRLAILALVALLFAAACSKNSNNVNGGNSSSGNSPNTSGSNSSGSNKSTESTMPSAGMPPTAVFKAYYDAAEQRDFATAKQYLSRGTLSAMEADAKKRGKTLEEMMKDAPPPKPDERPQLSNEQISGDTATVDMTSDGKTMKLPFVKEGGEWKIALDKFFEEMMKGLEDKSSAGENGGNANTH